MNTTCLSLAFLLFSSLGFAVQAQQHVHGQGELYIALEGKTVHVHLVVAAADVLGFEHEPETSAQKARLHQLANKLETNADVVELDGRCALVSVEHSLEMHEKPLGDTHHAPKHEEHEEFGHHDEQGHQDIEVEYQFSCEGKVSGISVALFDSMPSLSAIQAQWITESGQGLSELSADQPFAAW